MRRHDGSCRQIVCTQPLEELLYSFKSKKSDEDRNENGIGTQSCCTCTVMSSDCLFSINDKNSKENETFILFGLQGVQAGLR